MKSYINDNIRGIGELICSYYGLKYKDIEGKSRKQPRVTVRQLIWKISRDIYGSRVSFSTLGAITGNRAHSTVLAGIKSINDLIYTNRDIEGAYLALKKIAVNKLMRIGKIDEPLEIKLISVLKYTDMVNTRIALRQIICNLKK